MTPEFKPFTKIIIIIIIIIIIKPELNSANKLEAINTLAVSVVNYSFNIINRTLEELAKLDTKTRKFLTMYKIHHQIW